MAVLDELKSIEDEFIAIRRDIHAHPELAFQEMRTSKLIADLLTQWGIEVHTGVGKTGVVGVLKGSIDTGKPRRAIGIRADIDALPMLEKTDLPYASTIKGCMHSCGHDGHTATLLCAAKYLAEHRDFEGVVNFIFQPAEEAPPGGAKAMIDDGLFERFPCDEFYGLHNRPNLPMGHIGCAKGAAMASSNSFTVYIKGKGGHAAMPHKTIDPVVIAAEMILAMQTVISRRKDPGESGVLSVTQVHAGDADNIIPDEAMLNGTVRTFDMALVDQIEADMKRIVETLPQMYGASGTLEFRRGYPVLVNADAQRDFVLDVARKVLGDASVHSNFPRRSGSEDFAYYLQKVPGAFFNLGGARDMQNPQSSCEVHNPHYDFNDESIRYGAALWVELARAFFAR